MIAGYVAPHAAVKHCTAGLGIWEWASASTRATLRTLAEIAITLAYLVMKDDTETWKQYRNYGVGQAKLAYMKQESGDDVSFAAVEVLESLANEDRWEEFVSIDLGNWEKKNLRKLAEASGTKDLYDLCYDWTSHHAHGHWGAVRESVFLVCANPLHRFHRVLAPQALAVGDVLPDAARVMNRILDSVRLAYPAAGADPLLPVETTEETDTSSIETA